MSTYIVDIVMGLVSLLIIVWAIRDHLLRAAVSILTTFFATMIAGLLNPFAVAYFEPILGESRMAEAILFWLLFVGFLIAMEASTRKMFPDMRFPKLRVFDQILAVLPGIIVALIICGLFLACWAYVKPELPGFDVSYSCAYITQAKTIFLKLHPWFYPPRAPMLNTIPPCAFP